MGPQQASAICIEIGKTLKTKKANKNQISKIKLEYNKIQPNKYVNKAQTLDNTGIWDCWDFLGVGLLFKISGSVTDRSVISVLVGFRCSISCKLCVVVNPACFG